ncbi:MAG: hypothetical protein ACOX4I_09270 [Anaerovoracaceae bacterium]
MKKLIAIAVSFALIGGSLLIPHAAASAADSQKEIVVDQSTLYECDMVKSLQKKPCGQLMKMGYSKDEIVALKAIKAGRSRCGVLKYTVSYYRDSFKYRKGITRLKTKMTFHWTRRPVCQFTDVMAMTTSKSFHRTGSWARVTYYLGGNTGKNRRTISKKVRTVRSGIGTYCRYAVAKRWLHGHGMAIYTARSGYMVTSWQTSGKVKCAGISSNYGHTVIKLSPCVTFTPRGAEISFSPSRYVKYGPEAYSYVCR